MQLKDRTKTLLCWHQGSSGTHPAFGAGRHKLLGCSCLGGRFTALGLPGHQTAQGRGCAEGPVVGQTAGLNMDTEGDQT